MVHEKKKKTKEKKKERYVNRQEVKERRSIRHALLSRSESVPSIDVRTSTN